MELLIVVAGLVCFVLAMYHSKRWWDLQSLKAQTDAITLKHR